MIERFNRLQLAFGRVRLIGVSDACLHFELQGRFFCFFAFPNTGTPKEWIDGDFRESPMATWLLGIASGWERDAEGNLFPPTTTQAAAN